MRPWQRYGRFVVTLSAVGFWLLLPAVVFFLWNGTGHLTLAVDWRDVGPQSQWKTVPPVLSSPPTPASPESVRATLDAGRRALAPRD